MITFLNFLALRGPNLWTYRPVIEAWVDIGELEESPSNTLPGFNRRLTDFLPTLAEHRCSYGEPGGFLKRLEEGTWAAHILEHVTLELQNLAGMPGGFGKARSTSRRGVYKVAVRCWHEDITRQALHDARDLIHAAIADRPFVVEAAVARLREMADDLLPGPSTRAIVEAATSKARRIPAIRLGEGSLFQLGYGARSRRIWTAETDATSAIGESISKDKELTNRLLRSCGVPVPEGAVAQSVAAAWDIAEDIGLPVTAKPVDGNHGRGVSVNLATREAVLAAFDLAAAASRCGEVLIERFIEGNEHRLLVVGGKLVAAARGEAAWVTGDGRSTVQALIDAQINTDPRRGAGEDFPLNLIRIADDPVVALELARQGVAPDAVPRDGQRLLIQRNGNVAIDCTDAVHPDTARLAALAARVVGLDIAGIDLVAKDISRPLAEQGGAFIEVNAGPGLLAHIKPARGQPQPVGDAIVDYLFPPGAASRIPLVGVSGSGAARQTAIWLHRLLCLSGKMTGLATDEDLFIGERALTLPVADPFSRAQHLLTNRALELAVIATSPAGIAGAGLPYDRCQVGVISDIDPQALLPEFFIDDGDRLHALLRTQVDVVLPGGVAVLNAAMPEPIRMADLCDGAVIFFARDEAAIPEHPKRSAALFLRGGNIVVQRKGMAETPLPLPAAISEKLGAGDTANNGSGSALLAAVAAAVALDLPLEMIRGGLVTLDF